MAIIGANEIYRKLSSQIDSQFPEFLREDGPKFLSFLRAYYEYMEQTGKAGDASRSLFDVTDIDRTIAGFVEYFHREFMSSIPRTVLADKALLVKHIREFYRARGSEQSYRFLFRILFDKEISIYYPGDDILRASDGRWTRETVIRGILVSGDPSQMQTITGVTSGATARVQEVLNITSRGLALVQIRVEDVVGTFQDEIVEDELGNSIRLSNMTGSLGDFTIVDGGAYHETGDALTLSGAEGGSATGVVTSTKATGALTFRIVKGGSGYRIANTTISINDGDPLGPASFRIASLSNTQSISIGSDLINSVKNVILSTGATFATGGSNSTTLNASLAAANIYSTLTASFTFSSITVGSIQSIYVNDPGHGYGYIPTVTVVDQNVSANNIPDGTGFKGRNAVIVANNASGVMTGLSITTSDVNFLRNDIPTITNTTESVANVTTSYTENNGLTRQTIRRGWYGANGSFVIASTFQLPGRYLDTKGFLSWNNRLQDSYYYQEFSYDISVNELVDAYRKAVRDLLNPAGTKMFGTYLVETLLDASSYLDVDSSPNITGSEAAVDIEIDLIIAESVTASDAMSAGVSHSDSVAESVTSTDSFVVTVRFAPAVSESVTSLDATDVTVVFAPAIAETFSGTDVFDTTVVRGGGVTETVTASDDMSASVPHSDSVAESVTSTDSFVVTVIFAPAVSESVTSLDAVTTTVVFAPAVSESVTSTDSLSASYIHNVSLTETVTATDVFNAFNSMVAAIAEVSGLIQSVESELISVYQSITIEDFMSGKHNLEDVVSRS